MRRNVFAWAKACERYLESCGRLHRLVMVRLSYHYDDDWKPLAIAGYVKRCRAELGDKLLSYIWVAGLQERGVIHYHVLLLVKRGTEIAKPDEAGWWNYGSTRIETARSPYYICKYTGKEYQKNGRYPKGARVCGCYIRKGLLTEDEMRTYRLERAPKWVREDRLVLVGSGAIEDNVVPIQRRGRWVLGWLAVRSPWRLEGFSHGGKDHEPKADRTVWVAGRPAIQDHWYFADGFEKGKDSVEKATKVFEEWRAKIRLTMEELL